MSEKWATKIAMIFSCVLLASSGSLAAGRETVSQLDSVASILAPAPYPILHAKQTVALNGVTGEREATIEPGDNVTFTVQVTNSGGVPAQDVLFLANLPEGLTFNGDFGVDGVGMLDLPLGIAVSGRTIVCHGLSVPAVEMACREITFSARVNAPPPEGVTRMKNTVEVFCSGDPESGMFPLGRWTASKSNSVRLTFKKPIVTPFPVLKVKNNVTTQDGVTGKRAHVQPGDEVTFTMSIKNVGDRLGTCLFTTFLEQGLKYVDGSFAINGTPQTDVIVSGEMVAFHGIQVASHREPGDVVTVSFNAKVDSLIPASVRQFKNVGQLIYLGDPRFEASTSSSNAVILTLQ